MNQQADNDSKLVADAYRASSNEAAPETLNRAVLQQASRVTPTGRLATLYSWCRPLAFAATLVIGVALIYDIQNALNEPEVLTAPADKMLRDTVTPPRYDSQQTAAPAAPAAQTTKPTFAKPQRAAESSAPEPITSKPSAAVTDAGASSAGNARAKPTLQESRQFAPQAASRKLEMLRSDADSALVTDADTDACAGTYTESPERWWRCVQYLRTSGEPSAADTEWRQLQAAYPDFAAPD